MRIMNKLACGLIAPLMMGTSVLANEAVPGEFIVKLKGDSALMNSGIFSEQGINVKETINAQAGNFAVVKIDGDQKALVSLLVDNENVEYVEPNYIYKINPIKENFDVNAMVLNSRTALNYTPADEKFGQLWGLNNTGDNGPSGIQAIAGADVDALKAWEITKGSRAVTIAVIDTGVDYNHPDLKNQMWTNEAELNGEEGVDDDGNGYVDDIYGYDFANNDGDPIDGHSHGTHCAGTIGAEHDTQGVAGVMKDVRIMGVKFLTDRGSGTTANAIKSIDYATKMNVDIMSNSWGGGGFSQALMDSIVAAKDAGIVFVAAAGNSATNNDSRPHYPSNYEVDNVISVAATTAADGLASFSCYGVKTVHIGAPGHKILSTTKEGGYASYSGTSMATPHVSGIIGLLIAKEGRLDPLAVRNRVMKTSEPLMSLKGKTVNSGRVNAFYLLTNHEPERKEPKPGMWERVLLGEVWESAHPYVVNSSLDREVKVEGAKFIRLRVSRYETEKRYDYITVADAKGFEVDKISGTGEDYVSNYAEGDTLKLHFHSDRSVVGWGFLVDEVEVQY